MTANKTARHMDGFREQMKQHALKQVTLPLLTVTGIALTSFMFLFLTHEDEKLFHDRVLRGAQNLATYSEDSFESSRLEEIRNTLLALRADIQRTNTISQQKLESYLWSEEDSNYNSTRLRFLPKITSAQLDNMASLPIQFSTGDYPDFTIMEFTKSSLREMTQREEYFPLIIEAKNQNNELMPFDNYSIGQDYSADPLFRLMMNHARDTGTVSYLTAYPFDPASQPLVIISYYLPLYSENDQGMATLERQQSHIGFLEAVSFYETEEYFPILPDSLRGLVTITLPLTDTLNIDTLPEGIRESYEEELTFQRAYLDNEQNPHLLATQGSLQLKESTRSLKPWLALLIGSIITALLSTFVLISSRLSAKILFELNKKTSDLEKQTYELRKSHNALDQSEQRYRMLADNANDIIYTHDINGICDYISPSVTLHTGLSPDDFIGNPVYHHYVSEDAETIKQGVEIAAKTVKNDPNSYKLKVAPRYQVKCKDGSLIWMESTVSTLFDNNNKAIGFIGLMRNINDRVQAEIEKEELEENFRQSQKLEAIGTLAGGIAHDFNNLLTVILGHTDLLKLDYSEDCDQKQNIDVIERAANRAQTLTAQLLGFARKGQYQVEQVDVNDILSEICSMFSRTAQQITLKEKLSEETPKISGDPSQISQIFLNLAVNARDAMPEGGIIEVYTETVQLDETFCQNHTGLVPGKYCHVSFSDSGCGIPEENIEHIFEPFFTDKLNGESTGMGLAMVYGVTTNHGGAVTVDSEQGVGSVFHVYLPLLDKESYEAICQEPSSAQTTSSSIQEPDQLHDGKGTILVVDDEEMLRKLSRKMLVKLGYKVKLAEDGQIALEQYQANWQTIDMVLMDMVMPNMGGLECVEKMKLINPDLKAIMVTGYNRDSIAAQISEEYVKGFLQKPYRIHELSKIITEIL